MDGVFSMKSDVFSFGVVVLEILSGKRNKEFYKSDKGFSLSAHVSNGDFHIHTLLFCLYHLIILISNRVTGMEVVERGKGTGFDGPSTLRNL